MTPTYSNQADDFLNKLPVKKSERIKRAIKCLPAGDVKKLKELKMLIVCVLAIFVFCLKKI